MVCIVYYYYAIAVGCELQMLEEAGSEMCLVTRYKRVAIKSLFNPHANAATLC